MNLIDQLKRQEGKSLKPYQCTEGYLTIGYGRNLDSKGITEAEAEQLLLNDVAAVREDLFVKLPWYVGLSDARQAVLENMAFNLGVNGLLGFKKMLSAAERGEYSLAAEEMLDSKWAVQVKGRAEELSNQMRLGVWQ